MGHSSETDIRLELINSGDILEQKITSKDVWVVKLPYYEDLKDIANKNLIIHDLNTFIERLDENATIVILSSPILTAEILSNLTPKAYFKLWIGVKLKDPIPSNFRLPQNHAALSIITRYKQALVHSKTRIGYSFCPYCNKTTKDYGGKKHLYDAFGTIMSDIWRDIEIDYIDDTNVIVNRLQDLFAIPQYKYLKFIDLSNKYPVTSEFKEDREYELQNNLFNFEDDNKSRVVNGDCLEVLKKIPSNSIDFCFADPPYNVNKKYDNWDDAIDIKEYFKWCDKWLSELARIIKPGKTVAILNIPQWAIRHFKCLNELLEFQDWIIWEGLSVPVRMIMPAHYSIICFTKGKPSILPSLNTEHTLIEINSLNTQKEFYCIRSGCIKNREKANYNYKMPITNLWWDIHRLKHNSKRVDHPTQLPPMLMYRLISTFTNEGDIVLDPFNGSGTTTLCASQLKRKYFGIELSEKYFEISIQRHNELKEGIDPFGKRDITPKAKNSTVQRLKKQKYEVDKKTLQLELKDISQKINRVPNREDAIQYSMYPINYFDDYFINWGEATAAVRATGMKNVENREDYDTLFKSK